MIPCYCPGCQELLKVKSLRCDCCGTEVTGIFDLPVLTKLTFEEQKFVLDFVKSSGSLKEMSRQLGLSYPTIRNLLDEIIQKIISYEK